jgi:hypothetical protein
MVIHVEVSINDISNVEIEYPTFEDALASVEGMTTGGTFIKISHFEKTPDKYEWIVNTCNFIGISIAVKIEIKEVV